MEERKLLPDLPPHTNLAALSSDARNHRARFVRHILSELDDPAIDRRLADWTRVIEDALDILGQHVARGDWLAGFRRRTETARQHVHRQGAPPRDHALLKGKADAPSASWPTTTSEGSPGPGSDRDEKPHVLAQMQKFASLPSLPSPNPVINHLVLCAAPYGTHVAGVAEAGGLLSLNTVPQVGCIFTPSVFSDGNDPSSATVLYGCDGWDAAVALSERTQLHVVGGSFVIIGATSASQHRSLIPVLRAAIHMHLALILEQHLLSDSDVHLKFRRPKRETQYPSEPRPKASDAVLKTAQRGSGIRSTFLNLFSKRTFGHRSSTVSSIADHPNVVELSRNRTVQFPRKAGDESPRSSLDSIGQRIRRFSLRGDAHAPAKPRKPAEYPNMPFSTAVLRIENSKDLLSTSFDVSFRPPEVLLSLAEYEKQDSARRARGRERCALTTLLGWDSKDNTGKGMSGLLGFTRHQCLSVLVSRHIRHHTHAQNTPAGEEPREKPKPSRFSCGRPRWKTFWYYDQRDLSLGEVIEDFSSVFSMACDQAGCSSKCGEHQLKFTHGKTCVEVGFSEREEGESESQAGGILMWNSCAVCGAKSDSKKMGDGTYLLSFAKYLEMLIYSVAIHSPFVCEHTAHSESDPSGNSFRFNFLRHFSTDACTITFSLAEERDIFQLHLPRLQICRAGDKINHPMCPENCQGVGQGEEARAVLRRQIRTHWRAVSDHLDKIEAFLAGPGSEAIKKALPRLPSATDEVYEEMIVPQDVSAMSTYWAPTHETNGASLTDPVVVRVSRSDGMRGAPMAVADPHSLLSSMRHSFQRIEQSLYAQLSRTPIASLNDVRWTFQAAGRGAQKRIAAWKKKHLSQQQDLIGELSAPEPDWWDKKCHALPGGNVVVNEDDWGSIIAFTLSSSDFLQELSNISLNRSASSMSVPTTSTVPEGAPSPPASSTPSASSAVATTKGYKFFSNSGHAQQPDPDKDDAVWHESDTYAAVVTRKEVSRDSASLLSIRDMLRHRVAAELGASGTRTAPPTPRSAWAKPEVQLSMEAAGGEVAGLPDTVESAGKILQELEAIALVEEPRAESVKNDSASVSSTSMSTLARRVKAPAASTGSSAGDDAAVDMHSVLAPDLPPKDHPPISTQGSPTPTPGQGRSPPSLANTFTNSLSYALRLISSGQSTPRGAGHSAKAHHGLLNADGAAIDERPHIKYEAMVGKHFKISCTVYYAKQFDLLRKRCGVDDVFVKSLSRSSNWQAEGGKSRANFWKTSDDRFVIKTLVNAWNVADLHVLQELAPACFQYVESTASRPTALVKLLGYYTIEVKNHESGVNNGRIDLVVMENLFYDRKVDKTFDLKGIQGRKVKPTANDLLDGRRRQTLFDGEWIEGTL
ncbi:hypothetical protein AX14_005203 [Amanita brunnescens Koide BX004]|nr:hypothetical protein AX14_005203 [Amanita brunnescens Koide BX004]